MRKTLVFALFCAAAASPVHARDYKMTIGSSHPPVLPWTIPLKELVVPESNKRLKAKGLPDAIQWTEAYAGALYDFNNTLEGIGDGLADIGWVGSLWEPAKQPLQNVAYYSPFVTGDFRALVEVQNQLMEKVPAFAAEWTKHNTVFLGAQVADTYHLVTKFPVTKLEDLKGKKLLAPGAIASRVQGTGATPVDAGHPLQEPPQHERAQRLGRRLVLPERCVREAQPVPGAIDLRIQARGLDEMLDRLRKAPGPVVDEP